VLCILFNTGVYGQLSPFKRYTVADGLTENRVMNIYEDSRGFLWLLSKNGLTRYDGVEMIPYTIKEGLPDIRPESIFEDKNQNIWVNTAKGLAKYDGYRFKPFSLPEERKYNELSVSCCMDNTGSIFLHAIDTSGKNTLLQFNNGRYDELKTDHPAFAEGQLKQMIYSNLLEGIVLILDKTAYLLSDDSLTILLNYDGILFSEIDSVLYAYNSDKKYFRYNNGRLNPIKTDQYYTALGSPRLIRAKENTWIELYSPAKGKTIKWTGAFINKSIRDSRGVVWLGTEDGFYKLLSDELCLFDNECGIPPNIWSIVEDGSGDIWFTSIKGLIKRYDGSTFTDMTYLLPEGIKEFTLGSKRMLSGNIWFTTYEGILEWDGKSFSQLHLTDGQVEYIYEDNKDGTLMFGSAEGLTLIRGNDTVLYKEMKPTNKGFVRDICKINPGEYILVTQKASYIFDGIDFKKISGDPDADINPVSVETDKKGRVWLGGDGGLFILDYDNNNLFPALAKADNHPVRAIKNINSSEIIAGRFGDFIIINTDSLDASGRFPYRKYNESDGFLSSGFIQNGITADSKGNFWLIGNERVLRYTPGNSNKETTNPLIYLTDLETLNQTGEWVRKQRFSPYQTDSIPLIDLDYTENNIRLNFISISNETSENIRYRYRVSGRKGSWSAPFKERSVIIPAIKPGKHTVSIEVYNTTSTGMARLKDIHLNIIPAFWQTKIFITGSAILLIIITYIISRTIIHRINRKKSEKTKLIREHYQLQMGNFIQQFDPHFTFNVLNSLSVMYRNNNEELADEYLIKFSNLLRNVISENAYTRTLGNELSFIEDYCDMQRIRMGDRLKFSIDIEDQSLLETIVPRMLIHNFVENSIKWGIGPRKKGGKLLIEIFSNGGTTICISDDGIGREAATRLDIKGTGKGMAITKSLIEILNANNRNKISLNIEDLTAENSISAGTKVTITIPQNFNYFNKD